MANSTRLKWVPKIVELGLNGQNVNRQKHKGKTANPDIRHFLHLFFKILKCFYLEEKSTKTLQCKL